MKKQISVVLAGLLCTFSAGADSVGSGFIREVNRGIDLVGARKTFDKTPVAAPGALGYEVYETTNNVPAEAGKAFIPTSMYVRMGGGMTMDFATDKVKIGNDSFKVSDSYTVLFGLGWNLSSYIRTEIGFQNNVFGFAHLDDARASFQQGTAMLYFDFARRYVEMGDITHRRTFVPFMGVGAGAGYYEFEGANGANGFAFAAPRAELGFNLMLSDLIGLDIAYQYQLMSNRGWGWTESKSNTTSISNVVASLRVNF